jgi:mannose-6-phosphate isomerase
VPTADQPRHVDAPLHLDAVLVEKPWGGDRLGGFGRDVPPGSRVGESWDVADLDPATTASTGDPCSRVVAGAHRGRSLHQLLDLDPTGLLGDASTVDGRFPVLVKLLDAREPLSVQVHPPAAYVAEHPGVHEKTESWVVLHADADAQLHLGVRDDVTLEQLRAAVGTSAMVPLLRPVPAVAGAVHHLPSGTLHALGAGIVVAEVQTPSDTTFRVYDWTEELGREPRTLHLDAAMACVELAWDANVAPQDPVVDHRGGEVELATDAYTLTRRRLTPDAVSSYADGRLRVLQVLDGELHGDALAWPLQRGGTVVLPAAWRGELRTGAASTTLLETTV